MKLDSSIHLYAGGPGSGRRGDNRTEDQRKAIYQTVTKPLSVKEAQDNEEWHKGLEEMGVTEGILEAGEEQVEMESGPISRKLGKTIKQVGTNFCVIGNAPDVNLGCYNSREQAETVKRGGSFIEPDIKSFADTGEPMAGALGHAHLDTNLWFHPPSLKNADKIPTDDPKETNDRFLDVTKRKSKDTKKQRMQLLKRSSPGGTVQIPAHTTLIAPHQAAYLPGMFGQAVRTKPVLPGRTRLVSKSY